MLKKFFHNRTVPGSEKELDSSFDSGESEIVTPEEIRAATEDRYFFRKHFEFAPKSSDASCTTKEDEVKQKSAKSQDFQKHPDEMKRSRSFSFRFRPHSSSMFKVPRSKSVHFADEVQVAGADSSEPPSSQLTKLSPEAHNEENRSSSSLYTDDTPQSSASEETMKRVGQSLETIFRNKPVTPDQNPVEATEIGASDDVDSVDKTHDEPFDVDPQPLSSTALNKIYEHLCHVLELRPQSTESLTEKYLEADIHTCIDDLGANLKSTTDIMHSLKSRIKKREDETVDLLKGLEPLQQNLSLLKKSNEELQEEVDFLKEGGMGSDERKQMHQELTEAYQEIDKIVACYEEELDRCKDESQARINNLLLVNKDSDKKQEALQSQYNEATERCTDLENLVQTTNIENKKLKEVEEALRRQVETHDVQKEKLEQELKQVKEQLEGYEEICQGYENAKAKWKTQFNEEMYHLKNELKKEAASCHDLEESVRRLSSSVEEKAQNLEMTETQNTLLRNEILILQEMKDDSKELYDKREEEAALAERDKVKKLQAVNKALKAQMLEQESQIAKVTSQLQNCQQTTSKLQLDIKTATLKEKNCLQKYQAILNSNTFVAGALRRYMKTTFEILSPMFHHSSAEEFTKVFYEYSRVQIFDTSHHSMVTLLFSFLLAAVRDVVHEYIRVEQLLKEEIGNRKKHQKEVLQMFSKIHKLLVGSKKALAADASRSPYPKTVGAKKSKK